MPLLDRFQGALTGAAIADLMALNIIPASLGVEDLWRSPEFSLDQLNALSDGAWDTVLPGRLMVDVAFHLLPPEFRGCEEEEPTASTQHHTSFNADAAYPLARAIAQIPLSLFLHSDASLEANLEIQKNSPTPMNTEWDSAAPAFPDVLDSNSSRLFGDNAAWIAAWITNLTLSRILNETFCPKTHVPALITSIRSGATPSPLHDALPHLHHLHQALLKGQSAIEFTRAILTIADTDVLLSHDPLPTESQPLDVDLKIEAIALSIVLFCFLSTPRDYLLAVTRLKQVFHLLALPSAWAAPSCTLLGAYVGSYLGICHLPMLPQHRVSSFPESQGQTTNALPFQGCLKHRWGVTAYSLEKLGWKLWAIWSGFDRMRITSLSQNEMAELACSIAAPDIIRRFGN